MKRKGLIISNPGEIGAENYCEGVKVDVSNYKRFLTSPLGGAWFDSEIVHLDRPSCADTRAEISSLANLDYTFIAFSGHGYVSSRLNTTILELRKGEELDSLELRSNASKRTILLDCCRKVIIEEVLKAAFFAESARTIPKLDRSECRKYFDKVIEDCAKGIIVGYSCAKNETAGDSQSRGGYYSSSIMQSAIDWYETTNNVNLSDKYYCHSIVKAHENAVPRVRQLSGGTQNPEVEKPRSEPYFPFAIMA